MKPTADPPPAASPARGDKTTPISCLMLVPNAGSSSLKFALFDNGALPRRRLQGAAEAVALFCYQAKKCIGSYAAALGGLDTLVFAGGIGESASLVRARICEGLDFLGRQLDNARNGAHAPTISAVTSRVIVRIIRTDEELMVAQSAQRLLGAAASTKANHG